MHIGYKIWLEYGGNRIFGMGLYRLLAKVKETGSLLQAAEALDMSYRAAWGKIRTCEARMGVELLQKGRCGRAGTNLTAAGEKLMARYDLLLKEVDAIVIDSSIAAIVTEIKHDMVTETRYPFLSGQTRTAQHAR